MRHWLLGIGLSVLLAGCGASATQATPRRAWGMYETDEASTEARRGPVAQSVGAEDVYAFSDDPLASGGFGASESGLIVTPPAFMPAPPKAKEEPPKEASNQLPQARSPMLVYTAKLVMAVFEVESSLSAVEELAREAGGFLSKRERMAVTIRVPAQSFDDVVKKLEKLGDVHDRNIVANDVTDEFFDLEARLKSARAVQGRLVELLAKANNVEESVTIERELGRVNQEVERLEGRLKLLRDQLAYSTITATFRPKSTEIVNKQGSFRLPGEWLDQLGLGRLLRL